MRARRSSADVTDAAAHPRPGSERSDADAHDSTTYTHARTGCHQIRQDEIHVQGAYKFGKMKFQICGNSEDKDENGKMDVWCEATK